MHDAEASPTPDLWSRIDHDLTVQENKRYRERMVLYRQLAAACFVLFVIAGSLLGIHYKEELGNKNKALAIQPAKVNSETGSENLTASVQASKAEERISANAAKVENKDLGDEVVVDKGIVKSIPGSVVGNRNVTTGKTNSNPGRTSRQKIVVSKPEDTSFVPLISQLANNVDADDKLPDESKSAVTDLPDLPRTLKLFNDQLKKDNPSSANQNTAIALSLNKEAEAAKKGQSQEVADSRWSVSMGYMPGYFDQNIGITERMMGLSSRNSFSADMLKSSIQSTNNMAAAQDEYARNTVPAFSYTAEVKTGFKLSKKFKLLSGLGYSQNTARSKSSYIVHPYAYNRFSNAPSRLSASTIFVPSLNNRLYSDSVSVEKTNEFQTNYRYRHITIPVGLQYEGTLNKTWYWYASGGVATNILVESAIIASHSQVESQNYTYNDDDSPFRNVQLSGNVGLGVGKHISNDVAIAIGPEFRSFFNPLVAAPDNSSSSQGRPFVVGLNVGINYLLGKGK